MVFKAIFMDSRLNNVMPMNGRLPYNCVWIMSIMCLAQSSGIPVFVLH